MSIRMPLLEQHPALFDLKQKPSSQFRVTLEQLRQCTSGAPAAALASHLHVAHPPVIRDAQIANERPKAEWTSIRVWCLGSFEPSVQLPAIDAR
ncbi:hypothetical protein PPGU16_81710 (plasmid) [Paraburkholderia largidicola]|uniref:Uncharacterized protein n=1 Tax=Paraburkholderia largidicola TaxID=3014751 RepID=A0A7I8C252_9BURK|nr:hypothetical protein PPGU16_81710 [Paraburkholderia sp. PGU16]